MIKEHDEVAPTIKSELHVDHDFKQKTWWGSFFTIGILILILYISIRDGIILITNRHPYLASIKQPIQIDDPLDYLPKDSFDSSEFNNMILGVYDHKKYYYNISTY